MKIRHDNQLQLILFIFYSYCQIMSSTDMQYRLAQARSHYSHPYFLLGEWAPFGKDYHILNEYVSSCALTLIFAIIIYFTISSLSYLILYVWRKQKFTPRREQLKFEKQDYWHDIKWSLLNIAGQVPLVNLIKLGYPYFSKVQYSIELRPVLIIYVLLHVIYDEFFTYWVHRLLHHPKIFRYLHNIHHRSKAVTPFTGFAFHPLDAFLQAVPVFTSCYFLPLPLDFVLLMGLITSLWAVSIHDNVNMVPFKGILYAGSHSIHHFPWGENYNYGKFTSICDRLYGSYCDPENITGYGYETSPQIKAFTAQANALYTRCIPDNGISDISKVRELSANKLK